jgi:Skp family chaperone for outer membrane proteins
MKRMMVLVAMLALGSFGASIYGQATPATPATPSSPTDKKVAKKHEKKMKKHHEKKAEAAPKK